MKRFLTITLSFLVSVGACALAGEPPSFDNGFDLENGLIPANEIDQGGPGRDGIPAIDKPRFVARRVGRLRRPGC